MARNPARAAAIAVVGLVLVAVVARIWLARKIATPWIMVDELLYADLAKSFAGTGHFLIRGQPSGIGNVVYPALISPAWLFHSMSVTYGLAKALNVVLMALTIGPVYLWARRLVSPLYSVVAVALVLLMPSWIYTGMLMTENAFLPTFVLATFCFAIALERPTIPRQLLALATILLAIGIRYQGLVLVAIWPSALLLKVALEARDARPRRPLAFFWAQLRAYWLSAALLLAGVLGYIVLQVARGRGLSSGFGSYAEVARNNYSFDAVRHWTLLHFAELPLSVGVLPACALLLLFAIAWSKGGTRSPAERAFLAVAAAAVPWTVVEVAAFASRFSLRIEERYMFFLAPLLFLAFALWLDRGLPRPPVRVALAAAIPAALLFALPLATLLNISILSDTFGLIPFLRLSQLVPGGVPETRHLLLAGGIAAAAAFVLWPRHAFPQFLFPAAVGAFLVLSSYSAFGAVRDYSRNLRNAAGTNGSPSWIDDRLGSDGNAVFLLGTTAESWPEILSLWQTEFWNRSVREVYNLGPPEPAGGVETAVRVDPRTGRILSVAGKPAAARYAVSSLSFGLDGRLVAVRPPFALYRTSGELRVASATSGVYGDGWMGADATYTRYAMTSRGRALVSLSRAAWAGPDVASRARIQVVPLNGPSAGRAVVTRFWTLHGKRARTFALRTPARRFQIAVHIEPTLSPAKYGLPDPRQLGAQVSFGFAPRP